MASFKVVIRNRRADGLYSVYIRITHKREIGYIKTSLVVNEKGLTSKKEIKDPFVLQKCLAMIQEYNDILNQYDITNFDINRCILLIRNASSELIFSNYARKYIDNLINQGQNRSAKNYSLALQSLERYMGSNQIIFSNLTSFVINGWIESLSHTARAKEMYPICMRQVFRQAVKEYNDYDTGNILIKTNPWLKVLIPKADVPEKKAITIEQCREFFSASCPPSPFKYPLSEFGQDIAKMIFCLAGINTIDLYELRKSDFKDGIISYERSKTKKARRDNAYIEMRVPDIILPLFEKYKDKTESPYLFIFHERYSNSDSFNANVNIGIKQICIKSLGMSDSQKPYCAYTFRHTWATIAQNECGASIHEVAFALNHSAGHEITRGYIKINFTPAWLLNEKVIERVFFSSEPSNKDIIKERSNFERFSARYLIRGTLFFRGTQLAKVEDIGYNNVNEVMDDLMKQLPNDMPKGCHVEIRIENVDKKQKKDYVRTT